MSRLCTETRGSAGPEWAVLVAVVGVLGMGGLTAWGHGAARTVAGNADGVRSPGAMVVAVAAARDEGSAPRTPGPTLVEAQDWLQQRQRRSNEGLRTIAVADVQRRTDVPNAFDIADARTEAKAHPMSLFRNLIDPRFYRGVWNGISSLPRMTVGTVLTAYGLITHHRYHDLLSVFQINEVAGQWAGNYTDCASGAPEKAGAACGLATLDLLSLLGGFFARAATVSAGSAAMRNIDLLVDVKLGVQGADTLGFRFMRGMDALERDMRLMETSSKAAEGESALLRGLRLKHSATLDAMNGYLHEANDVVLSDTMRARMTRLRNKLDATLDFIASDADAAP